jgi:hypothetical protein
MKLMDIHKIMEENPLPHGEPVYTLAFSNAKVAVELQGKDPYEAIGRMLTAVSQYAYAAQLHQARHGKIAWLMERLPAAPVQIRLRKGSLPDNIVEDIVRDVAKWSITYIEGLAADVKRGHYVYAEHYVDTIPLATIIMISRHKAEVEKAIEVLKEALSEMKKQGTKEVHWEVTLTYHDGVPEEMLKRGFKEVRVVSGTHKGTDFEKFKEIMRRLGFELTKETTIGNLRHVGARKRFGEVELWIDCDSKGFGFITVTFPELLPRIPAEVDALIEIENVRLEPVRIPVTFTVSQDAKKLVVVRKVQQIGGKLAVYLTEPLVMLGVSAGDYVEVVVDKDRNEIRIKPLNS